MFIPWCQGSVSQKGYSSPSKQMQPGQWENVGVIARALGLNKAARSVYGEKEVVDAVTYVDYDQGKPLP
jgi:hypothetical protein